MKRFLMAAMAAAALLTACGGGGGNSGETKASIASVKVVGASLEDSGTFGLKFTVRSTSGTPSAVHPERIAATYGLSLCPYYTSPPTSVAWTTHMGCTNYAVAGARVHYTSGSTVLDTDPRSAIRQLTDLGTLGYGPNDLLIVGEASANDVAALVAALLTDQSTAGSGSPTSDFPTLLATLLPSSVLSTYASSAPTLGVLYMRALADLLSSTIQSQALSKGAQRVAVLNTLDVTRTPRFQAVLASLDATTAAGLQAMVNAWVQAYNAELASDLAPYSGKVVVVDLYTNFNDETSNPSQYGLTNVTSTVCDQVYEASRGITPSVATAGTTAFTTPAVALACTDAAASAITPTQSADGTSNWWQHYLYADNFHPTPYGHQLLAQLVGKRLAEAGWL